MKKNRFNYRREGEVYLIELKLTTLQQLFHSLDPAPFRDKDLAPAAEEYMVDSAEEFPLETPLKLVLHLPSPLCDEEANAGVGEAIRNYFGYRAEVTYRQFSRVLSQGRKAMLIGLMFLISCILAHHLIANLGEEGLLRSVLEEGFLIIGWVAMWHPVNLFLYEWWPIRRRQRLYEKLAKMAVELQASGAA